MTTPTPCIFSEMLCSMSPNDQKRMLRSNRPMLLTLLLRTRPTPNPKLFSSSSEASSTVSSKIRSVPRLDLRLMALPISPIPGPPTIPALLLLDTGRDFAPLKVDGSVMGLTGLGVVPRVARIRAFSTATASQLSRSRRGRTGAGGAGLEEPSNGEPESKRLCLERSLTGACGFGVKVDFRAAMATAAAARRFSACRCSCARAQACRVGATCITSASSMCCTETGVSETDFTSARGCNRCVWGS